MPACPEKLFNKLSLWLAEGGEGAVMRLRQALRKNREEEFQDYLNRISCLEKEIVNGEKTIPVLNKARITLEEYADLAESTKKLFMMLFAEPLEQEEVYFVRSASRRNAFTSDRIGA